MTDDTPRITGIGGIFLTSDHPDNTKDWYQKKLGMPMDKWGVNFIWRQHDTPEKLGHTQWSMMKLGNEMMAEGQTAMICYRVHRLNDYLNNIAENGVRMIGDIERYDYGLFAHIEDDRGERIQLWQSGDSYDGIVEAKLFAC